LLRSGCKVGIAGIQAGPVIGIVIGYPGSITGAMTGTPALNVVTDVACFGVPAV